MKRNAFWLVLLVIMTLPVFAGRIVYTVDPSTASPQPATVAAGGEGEVKVIFNASELQSGMVFTFTLDLTAKGDNVAYPVTVGFKEKGNKKDLDIAFEPAEITLGDGTTPVSAVVTVTLPEDDYTNVKKLKAKFKADAPKGAHLGNSAGVKIIIIKAATAQEFLEAVTEEIGDLVIPGQIETK